MPNVIRPRVYPEVPRRFPGVSMKYTEGFQTTAKICRNVPNLRIPLREAFRVVGDAGFQLQVETNIIKMKYSEVL